MGALFVYVFFGVLPAFGGSYEPNISLRQSVGDVVANGDGSYEIRVTLTVSNSGNEELIELQLKDDLDIFGPGSSVDAHSVRVMSGDLTLNPGS